MLPNNKLKQGQAFFKPLSNDPVFNIIEKFCFFFAPDLLELQENKKEKMQSYFSRYIDSIPDNNLRELTRAIIFSDEDKVSQLCDDYFSKIKTTQESKTFNFDFIGLQAALQQATKIQTEHTLLSLPTPRNELSSFNLWHLAAIFANSNIMHKLMKALNTKDIPGLGSSKYFDMQKPAVKKTCYYSLFDLSLLAGSYEILKLTFELSGRRIDSLSYETLPHILGKNEILKAFNQTSVLLNLLLFLYTENGLEKTNKIYISGNAGRCNTLIDIVVAKNDKASLQLLLSSGYCPKLDNFYTDNVETNRYQGINRYICGFSMNNIFENLFNNTSNLAEAPTILLRGLNLAILCKNFEAAKIILEHYSKRAEQDAKTYPFAKEICDIVNKKMEFKDCTTTDSLKPTM